MALPSAGSKPEMSWLPQPQSPVDCVGYGLAIHRVVTQTPTMFLCTYDLHRCCVEVLVEVLRLHPRVLVSGVELVNPYYVRPQNYPATGARQVHDGADRSEGRGQRATDADRWDWFTESEQGVAGYVVDGMTNRQIAEVLVLSRHTVDAHLQGLSVRAGLRTRSRDVARQPKAAAWRAEAD